MSDLKVSLQKNYVPGFFVFVLVIFITKVFTFFVLSQLTKKIVQQMNKVMISPFFQKDSKLEKLETLGTLLYTEYPVPLCPPSKIHISPFHTFSKFLFQSQYSYSVNSDAEPESRYCYGFSHPIFLCYSISSIGEAVHGHSLIPCWLIRVCYHALCVLRCAYQSLFRICETCSRCWMLLPSLVY